MIYTEERRLKDKKIDNAIKVLKTEFIGIDEQIEGILNNLRTWYLYPELQSRPLVISLWGLTGVGKTCIVKRIAELLDIEKDLVYFNFAEIGECSSWEIENKLEEELSNDKSNRMFVYDEFQYAATLDAMGAEKDKKSGLKPFWELLDNGQIHKRDNFWVVRQMNTLLRYIFKINDFKRMEIVNGKWVNADECLRGFNSYEQNKFQTAFRFENGEGKDDSFKPTSHLGSIIEFEEEERPEANENGEFFIKEAYLDKLIALCDQNDHKVSDEIDFYRKLCKMNIEEIIETIDVACEKASKGYDLDFKDSVIFVIGNLDEAYQMALDVDPDMSPDQFHKATKAITIVDIKKSLQKRFRNEQIARLGNIHMIYPSFDSKSFREIIKLSLRQYAEDVMKLTGYKLTYEESLVDIIYKDSVFPTHGTRPIFSSIHEIVKSKFPIIVHGIAQIEKNIDKDLTINYSYRNRRMIVNVFDSKNQNIYNKKFKLNLRVEGLRENTKDESQCLVGTHESGHFVMYAKLFGEMPEKLCSKTADSESGGFMMHSTDDEGEFESREVLMNRIKVMLGGYVAERFVFGVNNATVGSENDLRRATTLASRIVREYGMCDTLGCTTSTYVREDVGINNNGYIMLDDRLEVTNKNIRAILEQCYNDVYKTFENEHWKNMLKESALYLSKHSTMPKKKMKEIYNNVPKDVRKTDKNDSFYRDKLMEL